MKSHRIIAILFYLCAVAFYILAILNMIDEAAEDMWITWLCVGSMWLCLGSVYFYKSNKEDDASNGDEE